MLARFVLVLSLLVLIGAGLVWYRGERDYRPGPIAEAQRVDRVTHDAIHPGGAAPPNAAYTGSDTPYGESGYDVSQGSHLFRAFNCNGCHQNGGGGIGPALMDDMWIYGSEPRNIYETLVEGRPNGMPSFRGKLTDTQIWQLTAYVRSLSGLVPAAARSARQDAMQTTPPSSLQSREPPIEGGTVPPSAQGTP